MYSDRMDYVEVLRDKISRLRLEIAESHNLNEQYRRQGKNEPDAEVAFRQRVERLQAIQRELAQIADFGRKVQSVEEMRKQHRSRLRLIKKAS